jgi:cell wall-associated NlpC family hydrolase
MKKILLFCIAALLLVYCKSESYDSRVVEIFDEISSSVKQDFAPDRRSATYEVSLERNSQINKFVLKGVTTDKLAKEALIQRLQESKIEIEDSLIVLPHNDLGDKTYGVTTQSVINFRYAASYSSESATQTIMGMPLRLLEKKSYWVRAVTPEGYIAWVTTGSVAHMNRAEYSKWMESPKVIVTTHYTLLREQANEKSQIVSDAVLGNIVALEGISGSYFKVKIPKGKIAYLNRAHATHLDIWLSSRECNADNIIETAKQFLGFPYMWGGTSVKALDCSGFTKTVFFMNGVIINRDASQQALSGEAVDIENGLENLQKGDLLFFGSKATETKKERVTHVGIYIGEGIFIHSATSVRINSLNKEDSNYYDGSGRLLRARRYLNHIDKDDNIVSIKNHPWYFQQ